MHRPCKLYPSTVNNSLHFDYFLLFFSLIFWLYLHYLPYLEMYTDHVNSPHHVYSLLLFFPSFSGYIYIDYHIWNCMHTMLTAQQHHHTITILFLISFLFFHLKMQNFPYLANFSVHSGSVAAREGEGRLEVTALSPWVTLMWPQGIFQIKKCERESVRSKLVVAWNYNYIMYW